MENTWLPLLAAMLDWLAVRRGWDRLGMSTKPAVMLAVLAWMFLDGPGLGGPLAFIFAGVVFSLAGDVLLLPVFDRFLGGLAAFLLAHLAFIAGLNTTPPPLNFSTLLFAVVVALLAVRVYGRVRRAWLADGRERMVLPALLYAAALGGTLFSGLATLARPGWPPLAALLAASGAVLFAISDIVLAWNRFVGPIARARLKTRIPYQLGVIMIVAGGMIALGE